MRSWLAVTGRFDVVRHGRSHQGFYIALEPETERLFSGALNSDEVQITVSGNRDVNFDPVRSGPESGLTKLASGARSHVFSP